VEIRNWGVGVEHQDYLQAWQEQRQLHATVVKHNTSEGYLLLLEHPPVFTAGKRTLDSERPADTRGAQIIDVDRGGKITFHGPGQLVGYPIVRLPDQVHVVDYVRRIEEALIRVCADFGVATARVPGRSGVWLQANKTQGERKIAALGIRVSRGVTMHGFALNCNVDLSWYNLFMPCGIADAGVTSLSSELGRDVPCAEVLEAVEHHLCDLLSWGSYRATPSYPARPDPAKHPADNRAANRADNRAANRADLPATDSAKPPTVELIRPSNVVTV
jgi:lipoyl(octanoyl) transferase